MISSTSSLSAARWLRRFQVLTFFASAVSRLKSVNLNDLLQPDAGHFLDTEGDPLKVCRMASSENE